MWTKILAVAAFITLHVIAIGIGAQVFAENARLAMRCERFEQENQTLKDQHTTELRTLNTAYDYQQALLMDQINELEFKMANTRTYEEGVMDGMVKSDDIRWTDGYHAGIAQMGGQMKPSPPSVVTNDEEAPQK